MHHAQINIARLKHPIDDPRIADFVGNLDHLREHGPTDFAFGWESLPQVRMWKEQRCA